MMKLGEISKVKAITFDDFLTLRYPIGEKEDIIFPIFEALKREGVNVDTDEFLQRYFREDKLYRKRLQETLEESLLDDIFSNTLKGCGFESPCVDKIVREAVDYGLATRKARWFPSVKKTLLTFRQRGYKLGLISNTHWRISEDLRKEFEKFFDVITLSYEHGYAKPHPSIFIATLKVLKISANQCLHVGDDPVADIQGAKSVGMKTAFIKRNEAKKDSDIQLNRISDLATLL
jgi:HAD superfamily hydrolase (TIGR01662 family)